MMNYLIKGKLRTTLKGMERPMLYFTRKEDRQHTINHEGWQHDQLLTLNWQWARHIAQRKDDR